MQSRLILASIALSLGLAGAAHASVLTGHMVKQEQLQAIRAGESVNDVIKALGKPESITKWADGSRSAVYDTTDTDAGRERVYVDLDAQNNVTSVEVLAQ